MSMDLRPELFPEPELPVGYRIRAWSKSLMGDHADAKYRSFRNELDSNVFPCLGDSYGCHRLMRDISCRQGFVPESTWLIVRDEPNVSRPIPCGTIQGIREQVEVGAIQNIGIVPENRGLGLGSVLVYHALKGFQSIGLKFATLEVTAHNQRAVELYERLGFEKSKVVYKSADVKCGM
jgi:RimJ/RimL family protein N-acetyltransferase